MKKTIKLFEAFLGDKFYSWSASETVSISQGGRIISITQKNETFGEVTSRFDLDLIPAYTIA